MGKKDSKLIFFPKTKSVRDQFTIKQLKEIEKQGFMDRDPDPTK